MSQDGEAKKTNSNVWKFIPVDKDLFSSFSIELKSVIGRESETSNADIKLDSSMVSKTHCSIEIIDNNKAVIKDLGSSNGTYVNGKKISQAEIANGDVIKIDEIEFIANSPENEKSSDKTQIREAVSHDKTAVRPAVGASEEKASKDAEKTQLINASEKLEFILLKGNSDVPKKFQIAKEESYIGRSDQCDIQIPDSSVSSKHALITKKNSKIFIQDLDSTNGTKINNKTIKAEYQIKNGDKLKFGKTEFLFQPDQEEAKSDNSSTVIIDQAEATAFTEANFKNTDFSAENKFKPEKKFPAWIFGLIGLIIVLAGGASFFIFKPDPGSSLNLQMTTKWIKQLPEGRKNPTTAAIGDINGDDFPDAVFADFQGFITALDGDKGKEIMTTNVANKIIAPPVLCDLNGDGSQDIIICSYDGTVTALNGNGKILWQTTGKYELGKIVNRPVIYDVDNNGQKDVIIPTYNKGIVALDGERGWKIWDTAEFFSSEIKTAPLIADFDSDGSKEIAAISSTGEMIAFKLHNERIWKMWENSEAGEIYYASPVLMRYGKKKAIVAATENNGVLAFNGDNGRILWKNDKIDDSFFASPAVADINNDKIQDILLVSENNEIYLLDGQYGELTWNKSMKQKSKSTPVFYNVNKTPAPEIILTDLHGNIKIIDCFRGREILSFNINQKGNIEQSPVLADIDKDSFAELVIGSSDGYLVSASMNAKTSAGEIIWPFFLGDNSHNYKN